MSFRIKSSLRRLAMTVVASFLAALIAPRSGFADEAKSGAGVDVKKQGEISYVSGGIGDESQKRLEQMSSDFNLRVTLATPSGSYLGGSKIAIKDQSGSTVLDAEASGPLFFAELPAGKYSVTTDTKGRETEKQTVNVAESGQARVLFHLPSSAPAS